MTVRLGVAEWLVGVVRLGAALNGDTDTIAVLLEPELTGIGWLTGTR